MRGRGRSHRVLRRSLQLGVLVFVVYAAMGSHWRNYKLAHNHPRLVGMIEGEFWGKLYAWNENLLGFFGESFQSSLAFIGMPWSGRIAGLDTADPMLVVAQVVTRGPEVSASLGWLLVIPFVLAIVLGKVFCSHLCPMRLCFDLGQGVRKGLLRLGVPLSERRSEERLGAFVTLGGLLATFIAGPAVWLFVLPYVGLSASIFLAITLGSVGVLVALPLFWFAVDVLFAPGYFCHNLCPTGFVLESLGRFAPLRVRRHDSQGGALPSCPGQCNQCEVACAFSLRPKENLNMPACNRCGACVAACPTAKLSLRLRVLPMVGALLLVAQVASAHHNKGLPHYGYYENYPQLPVEEYVAFDGPWEMGAVLFNFQGLDRRTADTPNDVKIHLYLYDDRVGSAYTGPLEVEIRRKGEVVATFSRMAVDEEAVYTTRETLPSSGDYQLVALVGDEEVKLPFHVDLASDRIRWGWVATFTLPVLALFAIAFVGRKRGRFRRKRRVAWAS
jgi:ferredoxin-type protein NapH